MNKKIERIYNFVQQKEDLYYSKLTCGENLSNDIVNTAQAISFQMVRYFIESMLEENTTGDSTEVVHANWIDTDDGETRCSNCETRIPEMYSNADTVIKSECRFCHYCGAKMDGGNEDECG